MLPMTRVKELWRYPVKSMQGEPCEELVVGVHGVAGDRSFGVLDLGSGTIISAKRDGRLLEATAKMTIDEVWVRLPGGDELPRGVALDRELTKWLGREVRLVEATSHGVGTYECPEDFERDDSDTEKWQGTGFSFVDESDLHLLTSEDLNRLARDRPELQWNARRFRPNIVLDASDGASSSALTNQCLQIGEAVVQVTKGCTRCVMTTRAQPGGLDRELDILRHVIHNWHNEVGVRASVTRPGRVVLGDTVVLESATIDAADTSTM